MRVLVVEDDTAAAEALTHGLRRHGYDAESVDTGTHALKVYHCADLVLLDLELPDLDGLEVCRGIRATCDTPIIAVTACGTELDRVLGLQAGLDDCLVKPYGFRELLARIEAVMRRARPQRRVVGPSAISRGPLLIDTATREIRLHGELVEVTRKEFDLLYHLASHPEMVIHREVLMAEVWGDPMNHGLSSRASHTIDTHVSTLRSKLGASSWILTVRGVGFRLGHG